MLRRRLIACLATFPLIVGCADGPDDPTSPTPGLTTAPICGIDAPTLVGIDVSHWQGDIDWARVKAAGMEYAFIRVSDGIGTMDRKFDRNWTLARQHKVPRGIYQFFRPGRDAIAQADIVIDAVNRLGMGELPPVIDVEHQNDANGAQMTPAAISAQIRLWLNRVETTLGVRPIIYSGRYFWNGYVKTTEFSNYPFWHAQYTSAACPTLPDAWSDWTLWQYSSTGSVDGISGDVDMNRFRGTLQDLLALVPDETCRLTPTWQGCQNEKFAKCEDGHVTEYACSNGLSCTTEPTPACRDLRCVDRPDPSAFCVDETTVATCDDGRFGATACAANEHCAEGSCVPDEGGPVEEDVGPVEEDVGPVEEDSPDIAEGGSDAFTAARPLRPSRGVNMSLSEDSGGCQGGGSELGLLGLLVLALTRTRHKIQQ